MSVLANAARQQNVVNVQTILQKYARKIFTSPGRFCIRQAGAAALIQYIQERQDLSGSWLKQARKHSIWTSMTPTNIIENSIVWRKDMLYKRPAGHAIQGFYAGQRRHFLEGSPPFCDFTHLGECNFILSIIEKLDN